MSTQLGTNPTQGQAPPSTPRYKPSADQTLRLKLERLGQLSFLETLTDMELSVLRERPGAEKRKPIPAKHYPATENEQLDLLHELIDRIALPEWNEQDIMLMHEMLLIRSCKQLVNWRTSKEARDEIIDWIRDTDIRPFSFTACCSVIPVNSDDFRDMLLHFINSPKAITLTDQVKFEALLRRRMEEVREAA